MKKRQDEEKWGYVYLIQSSDWLKVGFSQDLFQRLSAYEQHNPQANLIAQIKYCSNEEEKAVIEYVKMLSPDNIWYTEWFQFKENIEQVIQLVVKWMREIEEGSAVAFHLQFKYDNLEKWKHSVVKVLAEDKSKMDTIAKYLRYGIKRSIFYYSLIQKEGYVRYLEEVLDNFYFYFQDFENYVQRVNRSLKYTPPELPKKPFNEELEYSVFFALDYLFGKKYTPLIPRIFGFISNKYTEDFYPTFFDFWREITNSEED